MTKEIDNIELRSEKVRNIIGQIPPQIIRIGISVIFFVIAGIITGSYFFEYAYTIKTTAIINQQNNSTIITVKIPANEISNVKKGHQIILNFDNIPNVYNEHLETKMQIIPNKLELSKFGAYYLAEIIINDTLKTQQGKVLVIKNEILVNAEIITEKISFFNRATNMLKL